MLDPERGQNQGIVTRGPGSADRDALDDAVTPRGPLGTHRADQNVELDVADDADGAARDR